MLPLGGRPLLEHLIALLCHHGVSGVAINLHHRPEAIVQHFGDGRRFGVPITYSLEEQLLGSAGAAKRLAWFFPETFLVLYGDVLTDLDLTTLIEHHRANGGLATIALYEPEDPTRCGIVELAADGRVMRFVEKPAPDAIAGNLANAGIYVLEPEVLQHVPEWGPCDFGRDLFPTLLWRGLPLHGFRVAGYVLDVGSPERYAQAQADLAAGLVRSYAELPIADARVVRC